MIIITDAVERTTQQGDKFVSLIVGGGLEMVKSQTNGKFYATTRKASIPCTMELPIAKQMIGTKMNGSIIRKPCDPYVYTNPKGEEIELNFTYEYSEEAANFTEAVMG